MLPIKSLAISAALALTGAALAASHNDAPMIMTDPAANISDLYAFVGNGPNGKVLNIIMNVNPLSEPGNGVNYYRFGTDVLYSINIARPGANGVFSGAPTLVYNFRFTSNLKNQGTILSYGLGTAAGPILMTDDAQQNMTQTYRVFKRTGAGTSLGTDISGNVTLKVPPVNVGMRTTPNYYDANGNVISGATTTQELDSYTRETLYTCTDGTRVWAGQREDGFYADVAAIFDFIGVRNPAKDGFSGYNVHTIAIQVPVSNIVPAGSNPMVGVYATTSRQKVRVLGGVTAGPWVQVGRMGNPLFNETLVALRDKDRYNMTPPTSDAALFRQYAENCELAFLLNAVLGTSFQVNNRTDLRALFIPDLLKVDTSTAAVPLAGSGSFNRLSVFGGDTVFSPFTNGQVPSGWPNGRRLGDDVVDIALTAIASGPSYSNITVVGDNVNGNDSQYNDVFPYAGTPFGGPTTTLH